MIELLRGVRVLECAILLNGDLTGRMLADLGADVVKVEQPGSGDYLRDVLGQITAHNSPAHLYANRNKRSVSLNLRDSRGREIFFDLLRSTDVFVDGLAGDACDRLGIGYEAQRQINPDIVYVQCTGFGASGPYASIPTHGHMMGAMGGGVDLEVSDGGSVDVVGGMGNGAVVGASYAALTAAAALVGRRGGGRGCYIDVAGSDSVLATEWFKATYSWNDARIADRSTLGSPKIGESPRYRYYQARDDKLLLFCAIEQRFWVNFCKAAGRTDLLVGGDEAGRIVDFGTNDPGLADELRQIFRQRTSDEWMRVAVTCDVPIGPANRLSELAADPQLAARGIIHSYEHPDAGTFTAPGWPALVAGQHFEVRLAAPGLGQHTDEVLDQIGITDEARRALRAEGVL
jgi:crotonobetainyl-CoA:carnitine CoA-transferase CaiB-like acyl-CoA transferase